MRHVDRANALCDRSLGNDGRNSLGNVQHLVLFSGFDSEFRLHVSPRLLLSHGSHIQAPPSMRRILPVMNAASSLARYTAARPISSGRPALPSGIVLSIASP